MIFKNVLILCPKFWQYAFKIRKIYLVQTFGVLLRTSSLTAELRFFTKYKSIVKYQQDVRPNLEESG